MAAKRESDAKSDAAKRSALMLVCMPHVTDELRAAVVFNFRTCADTPFMETLTDALAIYTADRNPSVIPISALGEDKPPAIVAATLASIASCANKEELTAHAQRMTARGYWWIIQRLLSHNCTRCTRKRCTTAHFSTRAP